MRFRSSLKSSCEKTCFSPHGSQLLCFVARTDFNSSSSTAYTPSRRTLSDDDVIGGAARKKLLRGDADASADARAGSIVHTQAQTATAMICVWMARVRVMTRCRASETAIQGATSDGMARAETPVERRPAPSLPPSHARTRHDSVGGRRQGPRARAWVPVWACRFGREENYLFDLSGAFGTFARPTEAGHGRRG